MIPLRRPGSLIMKSRLEWYSPALLLPLCAAPLGVASAADIGLVCADGSYDLVELADCIASYAPPEDSEGYVIPSLAVRDDWRTVVQDLLAMSDITECDDIVLPASLDDAYDVITFHDFFDGRDYCVAMEVEDADDDGIVDRGWGTLIVNPTPERYMSIDIFHPVDDNGTDIMGAALFKGIQAHTFVMGGSEREANSQTSPCQSGRRISDPAHSIDNLTFPTVVEIDEYHAQASHDNIAIQFHGMEANSCPDVHVYLTHGSTITPSPGDPIVTLKNSFAALQPSWSVATPGDLATCDKHGTSNVPGRYLNSGDEGTVCGSNVSGYSGKFIHVELDPDSPLIRYRNAGIWIDAIEDGFPPLTPPPSTTTVSFQDGMSYSGTTDTWLYSTSPTSNRGATTTLQVDGAPGKTAILRWDTSAVPSGATVREAFIELRITNKTTQTGYYAYAMLRDWLELQATWNAYATGSPWQAVGAQGFFDRVSNPSGKLTARAVGPHVFSLDPATVQLWIDDPTENRGIVIANSNNSDGVDFSSREAATVADRPKLTIVYED
jgi:hypothetical protein